MRVHPHIPIGEIAASLPHVTKLLDVLGIDYVLHGNLSLRDACAEAGVDPAEVRKSIEALPRAPEDEPVWADATMQEMMDEMRERRHPKLRTMLAETASLLAVAPPGAAGLGPLREAFTVLDDTLQPHMTAEEHTLFPVVQHLEDCWRKNQTPAVNFTESVARPIAGLIGEHAEIMEKLRIVHDAKRKVNDDDGMCSRVLDAVDDLEHELRVHIHLENNVLYPRAAALEAAVRR